MTNDFANGLLIAAIPVSLSGLGWVLMKVIQHDAWLSGMRTAISRIEDKLDKVLLRES